MKKTKRVFDLGLFMDYVKNPKRSDKEIMSAIQQWALECHGLTEEEMSKRGWSTHDIWMKEVEAEVDLTAHQIEILKALKLLDFDWIVRDEDGELCAHKYKPSKTYNYWSSGYLDLRLNDDLITFITWQDDEPTSIEELLNYVEGEQK